MKEGKKKNIRIRSPPKKWDRTRSELERKLKQQSNPSVDGVEEDRGVLLGHCGQDVNGESRVISNGFLCFGDVNEGRRCLFDECG